MYTKKIDSPPRVKTDWMIRNKEVWKGWGGGGGSLLSKNVTVHTSYRKS